MNLEQDAYQPDNPAPRRLGRMIEGFRKRIESETLHLWIADAFLIKDPISAPIAVERGETLEGNLKHVFAALTKDERNRFRAALSRTVDDREKLWPPQSVSEARALRDLMRLARLSEHYGMLSWAGDQLLRLMKQPNTLSDLNVLGEIVAIIDGAGKWAAPGPDHRHILHQLYEIFLKLENRPNLSFLDAVLLLPAVRCDPDDWHSSVCAAIRRYDFRSNEVIAGDRQAFGGPSFPEGTGVYDLRTLIVRVVREGLTLPQFRQGVRALVDDKETLDGTGKVLIEVLSQLGLLEQLVGYMSPFSEGAVPRTPAMQLAHILYLGPEFIGAVSQGLFQFVNEGVLHRWYKSNWALATAPFDIFFGNLANFPPIAILAGPIREVDTAHPATDDSIVPATDADSNFRDFQKFRSKGMPAMISKSVQPVD